MMMMMVMAMMMMTTTMMVVMMMMAMCARKRLRGLSQQKLLSQAGVTEGMRGKLNADHQLH